MNSTTKKQPGLSAERQAVTVKVDNGREPRAVSVVRNPTRTKETIRRMGKFDKEQKGVQTMTNEIRKDESIIIIHNMQVLAMTDDTITFSDAGTVHTESLLYDANEDEFYFVYKGTRRYSFDCVRIHAAAGKYYDRAVERLALGDDGGI